MKKSTKQLKAFFDKTKWLFVILSMWTVVLVAVLPGAADTKTGNFECFQITVESAQKVELETTKTGWVIKLYGKTESGCTGSTDSTVEVSLTITCTETKEDGSVRGVDFCITTTGMKDNDTEASKSLGATTTSLTYKATSGNGASSYSAVTIEFSDIQMEPVGGEVNTTFQTDDGGSYTVDGATIDCEQTLTNPDDHKYQLVAVPESGFEFCGWIIDGALRPLET